MIKSQLIQQIAGNNAHLQVSEVELIINTIFEEISNSLIKGHRVEMRGFGAFFLKERSARIGRNPKTGKSVQIEAKLTPAFRMGKELKDKLNAEYNNSIQRSKLCLEPQ